MSELIDIVNSLVDHKVHQIDENRYVSRHLDKIESQITQINADILALKIQVASLLNLKDKIICKWCAGLGRLTGDIQQPWYVCPDCEGHGYHILEG